MNKKPNKRAARNYVSQPKTILGSRGSQVDVQKCVKEVGNPYELVILGAARARQIINETPRDQIKQNAVITALLEIQSKKFS